MSDHQKGLEDIWKDSSRSREKSEEKKKAHPGHNHKKKKKRDQFRPHQIHYNFLLSKTKKSDYHGN